MSNTAQAEFDALIARNTAGPASHHPEDADENNSDDDDHRPSTNGRSSLRSAGPRTLTNDPDADADPEDYDDHDDYTPYNGTVAGRASQPAYHLPRSSNTRGEGNTGPKGVIADARAHEREQRAAAAGTRLHALPRTSRLEGPVSRGNAGREEEDIDEDDEDDDEEGDAVIRQWKERRLAELKAAQSSTPGRPGGGAGFGGLERVDGMRYLEVVEGGEGQGRGAVGVFIFAERRQRRGRDYDDDYDNSDDDEDDDDDDNDRKTALSLVYARALATIASKHSGARFIALPAHEAEMEPAGVPALLGYRDGDMFARIVPLQAEVRATSNMVGSLEECLKRHGIL